MAEKNGLKIVPRPTTEEENVRQEQQKQKRRKRRIILAVLLLVAATAVTIYLELRSYKDYSVLNTSESGTSEASSFAEFQGDILEYSNDGISCRDEDGELLWNQGFEMNSPRLVTCGKYLVVYDNGGTEIYIMTTEGLVKNITTARPIVSADIAESGTVAAMTQENHDTYVVIYDTDGNQLVGGEYFASKGSIPIDLALSENGQKLALDMLDLTENKLQTTIVFYNFGSVGQNEVNNEVGSYTYEDLLIPEIDFVSSNTMIALADNCAIIYEGSQKPSQTRTISYGAEISSIFHNDKYIGVTYPNEGEDFSYHIKVFDLRGKAIMENETDIAYRKIEFLSNNEICVTGDYRVALYSRHSIRRFNYTFDSKIYGFFSLTGFNRYELIRQGASEKINLTN